MLILSPLANGTDAASERASALVWSCVALGVAIVLGAGLLILRRAFRPGAEPTESTEAFTLHEFRKMRDSGRISDQEYESLRQSLLAGYTPPPEGENPTSSPGSDRDDEK